MIIAICDDQEEILGQLSELVLRYYLNQCTILTFSSPSDLFSYADKKENTTVDILLLDIEFEMENGITFASEWKQKFPDAQIIFVTGYLHYAPYVFDVDPVYFLTKPIRKDLLHKALQKAENTLNKLDGNAFKVMTKGVMTKIPMDNIFWFQSVKRQISVCTFADNISYYGKLDELVGHKYKNFVRCHQSFFVNMKQITQLNVTSMVLNNNVQIPISQSRKKSTQMAFHQYLGESL